MIGITLTGTDQRTPLADLVQLARMGAEIGLLYTFSSDGRNRYPSPEWIAETARALEGKAAIHVCGERARQQLYDGALDHLVADAGRIQVNGTLVAAWLGRVCARYPTRTIITQHRPCNLWLLPVEALNHALLVDGSGGTGQLPAAWERPVTDKPVGFAGGLGPTTLRKQLPLIATVASGDWWIDLESSLRDSEDWFSVAKAMDVMEVWSEFCNAR